MTDQEFEAQKAKLLPPARWPRERTIWMGVTGLLVASLIYSVLPGQIPQVPQVYPPPVAAPIAALQAEPSPALAPQAEPPPIAPAAGRIVVYEGLVDAKSAERLTNLIFAHVDKVIGLKLIVETRNSKRYDSSMDEGRLVITSGDPADAPTELVVNGSIGSTAAGAYYTVDGFYLIKSGGTHAAGAISYGAEPIDEATIRLNPHIKLVTKKI